MTSEYSRLSRHMRGAMAALIGASLVLVAPAAFAGKRNVVLLKVNAWGARAAVCKRAVRAVLRSKHNLTSTRKYVRTRRKLRRFKTTPNNVAAVSAATGTDAVVHVRIARRRGRSTLVVRVRVGKTGEIADTLRFPMRRGRCTKATVRKLRDELLQTLADVEPIDEDDEPTPASTELAAVDDDDPESTPDSESASTETSVTKGASDSSSSLFSAVGGSLDVGFSAIGRRLEFTTTDSTPAAMRPRWYDGGLVGGVHVDAELYPFMHKTSSSTVSKQISRIGISMALDHSVAMKSTLAMGGTEQQFATTQSLWSIGARYRIPLGRGSFKLAAGYDQLTFAIDNGGVDTGVPDVGYSYMDVGASFEIPLGSKLTVRAGGRYLHMLDTGEISTAVSYGRARVTGLSGQAGVDLNLTAKLRLRAGISFLRIGLDFDGSGEMTHVDADNQQDVGSASDTYTGGFVSAGYRF